jgi:hypothetical protein
MSMCKSIYLPMPTNVSTGLTLYHRHQATIIEKAVSHEWSFSSSCCRLDSTKRERRHDVEREVSERSRKKGSCVDAAKVKALLRSYGHQSAQC